MRERYFSCAGFLTQLEVPSPNLHEPSYYPLTALPGSRQAYPALLYLSSYLIRTTYILYKIVKLA